MSENKIFKYLHYSFVWLNHTMFAPFLKFKSRSSWFFIRLNFNADVYLSPAKKGRHNANARYDFPKQTWHLLAVMSEQLLCCCEIEPKASGQWSTEEGKKSGSETWCSHEISKPFPWCHSCTFIYRILRKQRQVSEFSEENEEEDLCHISEVPYFLRLEWWSSTYSYSERKTEGADVSVMSFPSWAALTRAVTKTVFLLLNKIKEATDGITIRQRRINTYHL